MDEAPDLLRRIDQLGIGFWTGTAYRHTAPGRDPLSGEGASRFGGRWNSPGISTLYLAFPKEACVQEFIRMAMKQPGGVESFQDRSLHELEVRDVRVLDLRTEAALNLVGIEPSDIIAADWSSCQEVGDAAFYLKLQGVLTISATGVGNVLALFEERIGPGQLKLLKSSSLEPAENSS